MKYWKGLRCGFESFQGPKPNNISFDIGFEVDREIAAGQARARVVQGTH
jgi:hypothetical protein